MSKDLKFSKIVSLRSSGNGAFSAYRVSAGQIGELLNPVIGFDDFRLNEDVFGPHKHVHMSALTYLMEDSADYHNIDSIGTDLIITKGSLLWTWAGSGVTHHEFPNAKGTNIHGLQLFLGIPEHARKSQAKSTYISLDNMPLLEVGPFKIKVISGESNGVLNNVETPEPLTFLDIHSGDKGKFDHLLPAGWNGTIYVLEGAVALSAGSESYPVQQKQVLAIGGSPNENKITFSVEENARFLFISGPRQ